jgi:hypothetical protein
MPPGGRRKHKGETMINVKAPTAREWERELNNEWDPQVHLTGQIADKRLQNLIDKHEQNILAHHLYSPLPGSYSLELQFKDEKTAREFLDEQ